MANILNLNRLQCSYDERERWYRLPPRQSGVICPAGCAPGAAAAAAKCRLVGWLWVRILELLMFCLLGVVYANWLRWKDSTYQTGSKCCWSEASGGLTGTNELQTYDKVICYLRVESGVLFSLSIYY